MLNPPRDTIVTPHEATHPGTVAAVMPGSDAPRSTARPPQTALDAESQAWVEHLRPDSPHREAAVLALHALLLRAARFEVDRRRATMPDLRGSDHADLAQQSADDAVVAVLAKLEGFRGESRFTTWAYKFALLDTAVTLRRRAWQSREVPREPEHWPPIADTASTPQRAMEGRELLAAVGAAIDRDLSPHQRDVLIAITVNNVPIDVLAERLGTTRGALYKTLHDARAKLRSALTHRGLDPHRNTEGSPS